MSSAARVQTNMNLRERAIEKVEPPATDPRQLRDHSRVIGRDGRDRLFATKRN